MTLKKFTHLGDTLDTYYIIDILQIFHLTIIIKKTQLNPCFEW